MSSRLTITFTMAILALLLIVSCASSKTSETPIPPDYTTYTSEGLFSISYPPDWEHSLPITEMFDRFTKEGLITSIESDLPVELGDGATIFYAVVPTEEAHNAFVIVVVDSPPAVTWTLDSVVETIMPDMKDNPNIEDYNEFSRVKTTVGGREVVIIDWQMSIPIQTFGDTTVGGKYHYLMMVTLVGKTAWTITCVTRSPEMFSDYEDDFHAVVRSFRILK